MRKKKCDGCGRMEELKKYADDYFLCKECTKAMNDEEKEFIKKWGKENV